MIRMICSHMVLACGGGYNFLFATWREIKFMKRDVCLLANDWEFKPLMLT